MSHIMTEIGNLIYRLCDRIYPGETDEQMAQSIQAICLIRELAKCLAQGGQIDPDLIAEAERFLS